MAATFTRPYRFWAFLLSAAILLASAALTVGRKIFKAANANPVESLCQE